MQVAVVALLERHAAQAAGLAPQGRAGLPPLRALWLFALAAAVEKPVHAEVAAAFRRGSGFGTG